MFTCSPTQQLFFWRNQGRKQRKALLLWNIQSSLGVSNYSRIPHSSLLGHLQGPGRMNGAVACLQWTTPEPACGSKLQVQRLGARIHVSNPGSQNTQLQPCTEPHAWNNMAIQWAFESNEPNALDYLKILSPRNAKRSLQSNTPRTGQEAVCPAAGAHSTTSYVRFDFSHRNAPSGSHCCLKRKRLFTKLLPSSAKLRTAKAFPFSSGGHEQVSVGKTSWFPAFCPDALRDAHMRCQLYLSQAGIISTHESDT